MIARDSQGHEEHQWFSNAGKSFQLGQVVSQSQTRQRPYAA
jgi:hypothetical protein